MGEWVKKKPKLFLFIPLFEELTYMSDPSTDFHAWWLKRRGPHKDVPVLDFVHMASI